MSLFGRRRQRFARVFLALGVCLSIATRWDVAQETCANDADAEAQSVAFSAGGAETVKASRATEGGWGPPNDEGLQCRLRLIRPDGLPVVSWSGGLWHVWSRDGHFTYPHLVPGQYTLQVDGSTGCYGEPNYVQEGGPMPVAIQEGQDAEVTVRMKSAPLDEQEIRRRWPWVVTGKVTDPQGKPVDGVTLRACYGTRMSPTAGQAFTGKDGSYAVRFTGTGFMYDADRKRWIQPHQQIIIWPSKPGIFERDLGRQGELVAGEEPPSRFQQWIKKPQEVLLRQQPRRIDFVMVPAAAIDGLLVDSRGNTLADQYLSLNGSTLPPLSHNLVSVPTEPKGEFQIDAVPLELSWWFETRVIAGGQWRDLKSPPLSLTKPGRYRVKLQVPVDPQVTGQLAIASVTDPQGAEVGSDVIQKTKRPAKPL